MGPFITDEELRSNLRNAQFVQQGLLPKKRHFNRLFKQSFVFYEPQDMLSGDFFWVGQKHDLRYLVVGDCTGHGISASLTTVLALNLFEYVIMNKGLKKTHKILDEVDKRYVESFKGSQGQPFDNPWIDLSIVCIDDKTNKLYYSSANRKMLHITKEKACTIYKPEGYPIGGWQIREDRQFETQIIEFEPGDRLYLGSDGFQDQFGGPFDKKYGSSNLHELLKVNSHLPFREQKDILIDEFSTWMGNHQQTDDVCIVGIEL